MGPSSVLLIDEKVIGDQNTQGSDYPAALSVFMMTIFNALERRESQWKALLAEANLQIKEIRPLTSFGDCIIIAMRA
jgi:hypothetical protein